MTPTWDGSARGTFTGLSLSHTLDDLSRAVFEGIFFGLRDNVDRFEQIGMDCSSVRIVGGSTKSPFWCQMKADVLGKPLVATKNPEGAAIGAAMTGGQYSPTTPRGDLATTAPYGVIDRPFDIAGLAAGAGASLTARGDTYHADGREDAEPGAPLGAGEFLSPQILSHEGGHGGGGETPRVRPGECRRDSPAGDRAGVPSGSGGRGRLQAGRQGPRGSAEIHRRGQQRNRAVKTARFYFFGLPFFVYAVAISSTPPTMQQMPATRLFVMVSPNRCLAMKMDHT